MQRSVSVWVVRRGRSVKRWPSACDRGSVLLSNLWTDHATVSTAHPPAASRECSQLTFQGSRHKSVPLSQPHLSQGQVHCVGLIRSDVISVSFVSFRHDVDNGYNNSLALYLHYLSLILMLFIVLLARGMSDHSVMSCLANSLSFPPSVICVRKLIDFSMFTDLLPELQVWSWPFEWDQKILACGEHNVPYNSSTLSSLCL